MNPSFGPLTPRVSRRFFRLLKKVSLLAGFLIAGLGLTLQAETSWRFGTAEGRDGDGGFLLMNSSASNGVWSLGEGSLRFENRYRAEGADRNNFTEAAAFIDLADFGLRSGMDFTVSARFKASGVSDWNRFGLLALAPDMRTHEYGESGFISALINLSRGGIPHLGVGRSFGGGSSQFSLQIGQERPDADIWHLRLSGVYDEGGSLVLHLQAESEGDGMQWAFEGVEIPNPPETFYFGFGGRFRAYPGGREPVIDLYEITYNTQAKPPLLEAETPVDYRGSWPSLAGDLPFRARIHRDAHVFRPLPTVVYLRNLPIPRLGTDSDVAIIADLLDEGLLVIELDCKGLEIEPRELAGFLMGFNEGLSERVSLLSNATLVPDINHLYWLPEGYRLARQVPFWNIAYHGVHGSLERIVETFNDSIVERFGVEPIESPEQLHGPRGEPLDYNLYLDIHYPSGQAQAVPVILHFSSQCRLPRGFREERTIYPLSWLTSGYALVYGDHIYNPLARVRYFGYFSGGFSLQSWNGIAAGSAAIRFLRAHAGDYNLNERIGVLGHSKASYSVLRLADPRHPELPEHRRFDGFPEGSPEPQPWPRQSSRIDVAMASAGIGMRHPEYTTENLVPIIYAAGRHDQHGYWNITPGSVARAEELDINHLAIWMPELGHTYPMGLDESSGRDRVMLVRDYFDQHLHPHGDDTFKLLSIVPAEGEEGVAKDGSTPTFGIVGEELPRELHGLSVQQPITVRFARPVETASLSAGKLRLVQRSISKDVPGAWNASLNNTRFTFVPDAPLQAGTAYSVKVSAGIKDTEGRVLANDTSHTFYIHSGND